MVLSHSNQLNALNGSALDANYFNSAMSDEQHSSSTYNV